MDASPEAQRMMADCFVEGLSAPATVKRIQEELDEEVALRCVSRRLAAYRAEQRRRKLARERMEDLVSAFKAGDGVASDAICALAFDQLMSDPEALSGADPIRLARTNLQAEELRLKKRKLELQERGLSLVERKLEAALEKERKADAALAEAQAKVERGGQISPDDIARIRQIYGLDEAA